MSLPVEGSQDLSDSWHVPAAQRQPVVKVKNVVTTIHRPIQARLLGERLLAIGLATGCQGCLDSGRYYLRLDKMKAARRMYRRRRRYW